MWVKRHFLATLYLQRWSQASYAHLLAIVTNITSQPRSCSWRLFSYQELQIAQAVFVQSEADLHCKKVESDGNRMALVQRKIGRIYILFSLLIPPVFFQCFRKYCRFHSIHSQFIYIYIYIYTHTHTQWNLPKPDPLYTGNLDNRKINFGTELFPM